MHYSDHVMTMCSKKKRITVCDVYRGKKKDPQEVKRASTAFQKDSWYSCTTLVKFCYGFVQFSGGEWCHRGYLAFCCSDLVSSLSRQWQIISGTPIRCWIGGVPRWTTQLVVTSEFAGNSRLSATSPNSSSNSVNAGRLKDSTLELDKRRVRLGLLLGVWLIEK